MRFKKGTKVEVLSKDEVPSGSWLCAEIIRGKGHHYTVKYEGFQGDTGEAIVGRVSRKCVRPCPPALELAENWTPGEIVEVYQNFSWKMATVLKVLGKKCISVRLVGSSLEFQVSKFDIRVRQSWQDDKWFVVGKGSASCDNGKRFSAQLQKIDTKTKLSASIYYQPEKKELNNLESRPVSFKSLKRGRHSQVEAYAEPLPKLRAIENEGRCYRARVRNLSTPLNHVQNVSFPRDVPAEECIHASVNNRKTGIVDMDIERRKQNAAVGCSFGQNFKLNCPFEDLDSPYSDAESTCKRGYLERTYSPPTRRELATKIHRDKFEAHRCCFEMSAHDIGACHLSLDLDKGCHVHYGS
ncbi:unnamed protein product [Vicia faba]|uniref:Agenet domain-containing protein n=1 Tax=Vicia faba TaxID=3906 RepID=A0AAV1ALN5_VICFA|nr:unnamed protein product [Vicia faba]